jgi:integrase
MMASRTKNTRWSYSAGEKGRNRVRAFEHATGVLMLEFRADGKRKRLSLKHRDRERAKRAADEAAAKLGEAETLKPAELTVDMLFDMYLREVTPGKSERTRKHDSAAAEMFMRFFSRGRAVRTLSLRDWERFIRERSAGRAGPSGVPVAPRTVERDLRLLLAACNWATMAGDGRGGVLLERNPFKGYPLPKEKNPRRVVITDGEYRAMLQVAPTIDWRFHVALVLANETGHRIGAIRQLRWSDVDLNAGTIEWRAEHEKTGYEHVTPMTDGAREVLETARSCNAGIGDSPVLPAPQNPSEAVGRYRMRDWWHRAENRAGLERKPGRGWHSLRRKFATDLMHVPLKVLCELGGWKTHETVLACYQRPNEDDMRRALEARKRSTGTG